MSLLIVGSVALDAVETPFGKRDEVLGGAATFSSVSAAFFTKPHIVAVVGEDFPPEHLAFLKSRGVDLEGLTQVPGRTFRWKGRYGLALNEAQTLDTQLNVFQHFSPDLPLAYRSLPYVFLGNIDPALQARVLDQMQPPRLVAADTMNYWIEGHRAALLETLKRVQLLFVNDAEARGLSGEHNLVKAARAIRKLGPERVIIKRGEYGALLFDREHVFSCPAYPLEDIFDPTGAGDTFAGGFMGYFVSRGNDNPETLRQAMVMGSTLASFTVERFSLERLREIGSKEISHRYTQFRRLTHFEDLAAPER